ncbi:MAG: protein kinase [Planctomycetota bacterium]
MIGTLLGDYRLLEKLGQGGMGSVYLAEDSAGERVALKVLAAGASDEAARARFRQEAEVLERLDHPGIVRPRGALQLEGERCYYAMELVEGLDLSRLVAARGGLPPAEALALVAAALEGLGAAHAAGIVHRDLKPTNLLVDAAGRVKLCDLGLARALDMTRLTTSGTVLGTPAYMSPEQARGEEESARSDLYSLGVVLYELLAGALPFTAKSPLAVLRMHTDVAPEPPSAQRPGLPPSLDAPVLRALAKDPAARFASAEEMRAALLLARAGLEQAGVETTALPTAGAPHATEALDHEPTAIEPDALEPDSVERSDAPDPPPTRADELAALDSSEDDDEAWRPRAGDRRAGDRRSPERPDSERAGPERAGSERAGPERAGSERAGPERAGSERAGPERAGPERAGSERAGPERAGPERADEAPTPPRGAPGALGLALALGAAGALGGWLLRGGGPTPLVPPSVSPRASQRPVEAPSSTPAASPASTPASSAARSAQALVGDLLRRARETGALDRLAGESCFLGERADGTTQARLVRTDVRPEGPRWESWTWFTSPLRSVQVAQVYERADIDLDGRPRAWRRTLVNGIGTHQTFLLQDPAEHERVTLRSADYAQELAWGPDALPYEPVVQLLARLGTLPPEGLRFRGWVGAGDPQPCLLQPAPGVPGRLDCAGWSLTVREGRLERLEFGGVTQDRLRCVTRGELERAVGAARPLDPDAPPQLPVQDLLAGAIARALACGALRERAGSWYLHHRYPQDAGELCQRVTFEPSVGRLALEVDNTWHDRRSGWSGRALERTELDERARLLRYRLTQESPQGTTVLETAPQGVVRAIVQRYTPPGGAAPQESQTQGEWLSDALIPDVAVYLVPLLADFLEVSRLPYHDANSPQLQPDRIELGPLEERGGVRLRSLTSRYATVWFHPETGRAETIHWKATPMNPGGDARAIDEAEFLRLRAALRGG